MNKLIKVEYSEHDHFKLIMFVFSDVVALLLIFLFLYQINYLNSIEPYFRELYGNNDEITFYSIGIVVLSIWLTYSVFQLRRPKYKRIPLDKYLHQYGDDLIWAYPIETTIKLFIFSVRKVHTVALANSTGKIRYIKLSKPEEAQDYIGYIQQQTPHQLLIGYSDALSIEYHDDPKAFVLNNLNNNIRVQEKSSSSRYSMSTEV